MGTKGQGAGRLGGNRVSKKRLMMTFFRYSFIVFCEPIRRRLLVYDWPSQMVIYGMKFHKRQWDESGWLVLSTRFLLLLLLVCCASLSFAFPSPCGLALGCHRESINTQTLYDRAVTGTKEKTRLQNPKRTYGARAVSVRCLLARARHV
nr:hypothetical protein [Pandoravirus massiliensis]